MDLSTQFAYVYIYDVAPCFTCSDLSKSRASEAKLAAGSAIGKLLRRLKTCDIYNTSDRILLEVLFFVALTLWLSLIRYSDWKS